MQIDAVLNQLGYKSNDALREQMNKIIENTNEFEKIEKHIFELHKSLEIDNSYVAMSNTEDYLKIKLEAKSQSNKDEALNKVNHFSDKYKIDVQKVDGKDTFYIKGFNK